MNLWILRKDIFMLHMSKLHKREVHTKTLFTDINRTLDVKRLLFVCGNQKMSNENYEADGIGSVLIQ